MKNKLRLTEAVLLGAVLLTLGCGASDTPETTFTFETMGTVASCRLLLPSGLNSDRAEAMVRDTFEEVNATLSTWLADSEISRLSRAPADSAVNISPLLRTCLVTSRKLNEQSDGAFDPTAESLMRLWGFYRRQGTLPSSAALDSARADLGRWHFAGSASRVIKDKPGTSFDLGAIAKGLAVDLAAARLHQAGLENGLIDLGGNLYCLGGAPGRKDWRVGIRNPLNRDELFAVMNLTGLSVATSGSYERFVEINGKRYGHIMNPATGRPAEGLLSATVIAEEALLADGLSTTLFVLGPDKARGFLAKFYPQVAAVLVYPGSQGEKDLVWASEQLRGKIVLLPGFEKQYRLVFADD